LERFCKIDAEGGRLTTNGWNRNTAFFVRPTAPPKHRTMLVVEAPGKVWTEKQSADKGMLHVSIEVLGRLDFDGSLSRAIAPGLNAPVLIDEVYELVFSDRHWELREGTVQEVKGLPEWRIESSITEPRVSLAAAVQYLRELKGRAQNTATRRRIEKTIITLTSDNRHVTCSAC
jgi:hypothetical protein